MTEPAPTTQLIPRERLQLVLERLQSSGAWSSAQSAALLAELDRVAPAAAPRAMPGVRSGSRARAAGTLGNRLAEAAAYAGAVLVGTAGAVLVGQNWTQLGRPGRVAVLAGVAVLLAVVGGVVAAVRPGGRRALLEPERGVRRRLAGTVLTIATASASGAAAELVSDHRLLAAGTVAVVGIALAERLAPSAFAEIAALGAVCLLAAAVLEETAAPIPGVVATIAGVGLGWATLSGTRLLTLPGLGLALGLVVALYAGAAGTFGGDGGTRAVGLVVLGVLAATGLVVYLHSERSAPAVVGVLALAALVLRIGSDSVSPVLAVLLTGVVLLGVGGSLLLRQRRRAPR